MKKIILIFFISIFSNGLLAQVQTNDCVNAVTVCSSGAFSSNANGFGNQEVAGCNGSKEHNTVWIKINIAKTGTLGFDLIPVDSSPAADFDFWVFGPNKSCLSLGAPIRCCITNPVQAGLSSNITGMNNSTNATVAYSGGTNPNNLPYVRYLDVIAGDSYYIAIDRPYNIPNVSTAFVINWTDGKGGVVTVLPNPPTVNLIEDPLSCSSNPNVGFFNLSDISKLITDTTINNVFFYKTLADAVDGTNSIGDQNTMFYATSISVQKVYAKAVGKTGGCYTISEFNLRVVTYPNASISASSNVICDGDSVSVTIASTPGATVDYNVDNGQTKSVVIGSNGKSVFTDSFSGSRTYKLLNAYFVNNGQTICPNSVFSNGSVTVTSIPKPTISGSLVVCQNATSQLTGSGVPATTTDPWVSSDTTVATVNPISGLVTGIQPGDSDITYTDSNGCSATVTVSVTALPTVSGASFTCVNTSTQLTGSGVPSTTTDPWVSSDTNIATVNPESGLVTGVAAGSVIITYTDINGCSKPFNMEVKTAIPLESATASVSGYFGNNSTITVTVKPDGSYLYKLDNGSYQDGNIFYNVSAGLHTVNISDTIGCTDYTISDILVVDYPHFFTPNDDGHNDTWNIESLSQDQPNSEIRIFDRFGKLLRVISPGETGWDGTYNGRPLHADDYWFTIKYNENGVEKIFKAHFTLRR